MAGYPDRFNKSLMDTLKHFIDTISAPTISFTLVTVLFPFIFPPGDWFEKIHRKFGFWRIWTKPGLYATLGIITLFFIMGYYDHNFNITLTKPDNFPIILLVYSVFIYTWISMYKAYENDERMSKGEKPMEYNDPDDKVLVWPDLVYIEFIALIIFMVFLIVWSVLVAAPLEEPANPAATPNPSKAPWYFLGLQEMLVYFDPWLAGVIFPSLIIVGLMAIPYMSTTSNSLSGFYSFKERRLGIFLFLYGFLILWIFLIFIGTFFRGPNWNFFGPFEYWDPHKLVPLTNVNLSEYFWVKWLKTGLPLNIFLRESIGFLTVILYFVAIPVLLAKYILTRFLNRVGAIKFSFFIFLGLSMLSLPLKMYLRWMFNLKYIIAIPEWFFNI